VHPRTGAGKRNRENAAQKPEDFNFLLVNINYP
jgi:hypothetical protein